MSWSEDYIRVNRVSRGTCGFVKTKRTCGRRAGFMVEYLYDESRHLLCPGHLVEHVDRILPKGN